MYIHPKLLKAARVVLDLSQEELAIAADVSAKSIWKLESFDLDTSFRIAGSVQRALEGYGVIFTDDGNTSGFKIPLGRLPKPKKAPKAKKKALKARK